MRCALRKDSLFIAYQLPCCHGHNVKKDDDGLMESRVQAKGPQLPQRHTKTGYQVSFLIFLVGSRAWTGPCRLDFRTASGKHWRRPNIANVLDCQC